MKYEEYGYVDIDKLQQIDNENYLKGVYTTKFMEDFEF